MQYAVQRFRDGYAIVWTDAESGKRRRYALESRDRVSAEAEARSRWRGLEDHGTVGALVEAYLTDCERRDIPSLKRRRDAWRMMKSFWSGVDPELIDDEMGRQYRATRSVSDATVRYELLMLRTATGKRTWLPPIPERKTRHLTRGQFKKFIAEIRAPHARLYTLIGIYTLARPSAILELKWSQVDLDRGLIDLNPPGRTQTRKRRPVVPINDVLLAELRLAHGLRDGENVISRGGQQIGTIKKAFQAASKRSGVHATPYTLRHTGAVWAAEQGVQMSEIGQLMGHDDSRTTEKHYARYSPQYLRSATNAISAALEGSIEP